MRVHSPFDFMRPAFLMGQMMLEAQVVIMIRLLGMAGALPAAPGEKSRMFTEKAEALHEAGIAMTRAVVSGAGAPAVAAAGMRPIRRRTKANVRRLTGAGPRKR